MTAKILLVPMIATAVTLAFFAGRWTAPEQPPVVQLMVPASLLKDRDRPEMVDVLIAKKELAVGTVLDEKELESMIGTQKIQMTNLPPDIINTVEELVEKRLNRTLKAGNFFSAGDVSEIARLPEGLSKFSFKLGDVEDRVYVSLLPGCRVDVWAVERDQKVNAKSTLVMSNLLVVSNNSSFEKRGRAFRCLGLAVTPQQSLELDDAEKRVNVELRPVAK